MSLESDLMQSERVADDLPAPPAPETPPPAAPPPLDVDDEAAVEAVLTVGAVAPPGDEPLVATSQVGKVAAAYRGKIKDLKERLGALEAGSAETTQLRAQVADLTDRIHRIEPYVSAYQELQQQPPAPPTVEPVDDRDAETWARRYDLYKPDGTGQLDLDRAKDILRDQRVMVRAEAERAAQRVVAPMQQQSMQQRSAYMLERAKATTLPNGTKADPAILAQLWSRVDPALTATQEGAQQLLLAAVGYTVGLAPAGQAPAGQAPDRTRDATGRFTADPVPAPVLREPAGGLETPAQIPLSPHEKRFLEQSGMTEQDYVKSAATAPWLRGQ